MTKLGRVPADQGRYRTLNECVDPATRLNSIIECHHFAFAEISITNSFESGTAAILARRQEDGKTTVHIHMSLRNEL